MKYSDRKKQEYLDSFNSVDTSKLNFEPHWESEGIECCYIGTVFSLTPSGKIYTFWTTNQTGRDVLLDKLWWEAFEEYLSSKGYFHDSYEENIYICRYVEELEDEQ